MRIRDFLTDEEFVTQRSELDRQKIRIAQNLRDHDEVNNRFEPEKILLQFISRAVAWFREGDDRMKRLIVSIVGSNPVLIDKRLRIRATKPFRVWGPGSSLSEMRGFLEDLRTVSREESFKKMIKDISELISLVQNKDKTNRV